MFFFILHLRNNIVSYERRTYRSERQDVTDTGAVGETFEIIYKAKWVAYKRNNSYVLFIFQPKSIGLKSNADYQEKAEYIFVKKESHPNYHEVIYNKDQRFVLFEPRALNILRHKGGKSAHNVKNRPRKGTHKDILPIYRNLEVRLKAMIFARFFCKYPRRKKQTAKIPATKPIISINHLLGCFTKLYHSRCALSSYFSSSGNGTNEPPT